MSAHRIGASIPTQGGSDIGRGNGEVGELIERLNSGKRVRDWRYVRLSDLEATISTLSRLRGELEEARSEGFDPTEGLPGKLADIYEGCANGRPINGGDLEVIEDAAIALRNSEAARLKAEDLNRKLVEGLRPFAEAAERWNDPPSVRTDDDVQLWQRHGRVDYLTVGDLRKARSLLSISGGEEKQ